MRLLLATALFLLAACPERPRNPVPDGGAEDLGTDDAGVLTITPAMTDVAYDAVVMLTASEPVTWSVVEPGGGTVDVQGKYVAPHEAGTFHVAATAGDRSVQATITVAPHMQLVAGKLGGRGNLDGIGADARVGRVAALTSDSAGRVYFIDDDGLDLLRVYDPANGSLKTLAGGRPNGGDGVGPNAAFIDATGIALDEDARVLYVAEPSRHVIRRVDLQSLQVSTIIGAVGMPGFVDGKGTVARLDGPRGLAFSQGKLYVADAGNCAIRVVDIAAQLDVERVAGQMPKQCATSPQAASNTSGMETFSDGLRALTPSADGTQLYVTELGGTGGMVRAVTIATGATQQIVPIKPDAGTEFWHTHGITRVGGTLYVSTLDHRVLYGMLLTGQFVQVAGTLNKSGRVDGKGAIALFGETGNLVADPMGRVYVGDSEALRHYDPATGEVASVVGLLARPTPIGTSGDGDRESARFNGPKDVVVTPDGRYAYVADTDKCTVRELELATGRVTTLAGLPGSCSWNPADASRNNLQSPVGLALEGNTLVVAESCAIRTIDLGQTARPAAIGSTIGEYNVCAHDATHVNRPQQIALVDGTIYWAESAAHVIRKKVGSQAMQIVAGTAGDSAGTNNLNTPTGIAVDVARGVLWIADTNKHVIRRINLTSATTTAEVVAGKLNDAGTVDGVGTAAEIHTPTRLAVASGALYFVEETALRRIDIATLAVTTVTGGVRRRGVRLAPLPAASGELVGIARLPNGDLLAAVPEENAIVRIQQ